MTIADPARSRHTVALETTDDYRWVVLAVTSIGALLASLTSGTLVIVSALRGPEAVDEAETEPARRPAVAA